MTGVPEGATLSQGALQSDGSWLIEASGDMFASNGLTLTVPASLAGQGIQLTAEAIATELNATDEADRQDSAFANTVEVTVPTPAAPDNGGAEPESSFVSIDSIETAQEAGVDVLSKIWGQLDYRAFGTVSKAVNTSYTSEKFAGSSLNTYNTASLKISSKEGSNETAYLQVGDVYSLQWWEHNGYSWNSRSMDGKVTRSDKTDVNGSGDAIVVFTGSINGHAQTLIIENGKYGIRDVNYFTNDQDTSTVGVREVQIGGSADLRPLPPILTVMYRSIANTSNWETRAVTLSRALKVMMSFMVELVTTRWKAVTATTYSSGVKVTIGSMGGPETIR